MASLQKNRLEIFDYFAGFPDVTNAEHCKFFCIFDN